MQKKRKPGELESWEPNVTGGKIPARPPDTTSELAKKIVKEKEKKKSK